MTGGALFEILMNESAQQPDLSKLKLAWNWSAENSYWQAEIYVQTWAGKGKWLIWFQQRPYYCDRGRYHCQVDGINTEGPDHQEGFPRYYFSLQRGMEEMEDWVAIRTEVLKKGA